jgi:hypothetical protein
MIVFSTRMTRFPPVRPSLCNFDSPTVATLVCSTLGLLHEQMVMSERPFVAIHSKYDQEIDTVIVRAVSQGSGPALDVEALLVFEPGAESGQVEYGIGRLAVGEKFHFLIGQDSRKLNSAALRYRSISGRRWRTAVRIMGGHPVFTDVGLDTDERTLMEFAFGQPTRNARPVARIALSMKAAPRKLHPPNSNMPAQTPRRCALLGQQGAPYDSPALPCRMNSHESQSLAWTSRQLKRFRLENYCFLRSICFTTSIPP